MSVLIYRDRQTAGAATATLFAAAVLENVHLNIGITYDSVLEPAFESLRAMLSNGLLSLHGARMYQLCEFVPKADEEQGPTIYGLLKETAFAETEFSAEQYIVPISDQGNWAQICNRFESDILEHGGLDFAILGLRPDGSLLYNLAGDDLAPVTHVEKIGEEKVVSAGMATLMQAKKLIVTATGADCAEAVVKALRGSVCDKQPASYLQLHQNTIFILDEEAASLL